MRSIKRAAKSMLFGLLVCGCLLFLPELAKAGGFQPYHIISGSMEPEITEGSIVFVKKQSRIQAGDIIAYHLGETVVTHRVTGITAAGCRTKGDRNESEDFCLVKGEQIIGTAVVI